MNSLQTDLLFSVGAALQPGPRRTLGQRLNSALRQEAGRAVRLSHEAAPAGVRTLARRVGLVVPAGTQDAEGALAAAALTREAYRQSPGRLQALKRAAAQVRLSAALARQERPELARRVERCFEAGKITARQRDELLGQLWTVRLSATGRLTGDVLTRLEIFERLPAGAQRDPAASDGPMSEAQVRRVLDEQFQRR